MAAEHAFENKGSICPHVPKHRSRYCLISKIDSDGPVYDRMKRPTPSLRIADNIFWLFGGALGAIM
jgi:hypothetical protein